VTENGYPTELMNIQKVKTMQRTVVMYVNFRHCNANSLLLWQGLESEREPSQCEFTFLAAVARRRQRGEDL